MDAAVTPMPVARTATNIRALIEDCCGWNKKTWADAVEFAISVLPDDLQGKKVIEIGVSDRSTVAPILAARGATVFCSYYQKPSGFIENGHLKYIREKYGLGEIPTFETGIDELVGRYDVIIMKSVLGGIFRNNDYDGIGATIRRLMRNNVSAGGVILTVDNGYIGPFHRLRRYRGTGGNSWTYLDRNRLAAALAGLDVMMKGFGYLNVASASLQFGGDYEFLNTLLYSVDKAIVSLLDPIERAVLSTIIRAPSTIFDPVESI